MTAADDAATVVGIAQSFARSLGELFVTYPGMLEAFFAGEVAFTVHVNSVGLAVVQPPADGDG